MLIYEWICYYHYYLLTKVVVVANSLNSQKGQAKGKVMKQERVREG